MPQLDSILEHVGFDLELARRAWNWRCGASGCPSRAPHHLPIRYPLT